MFKRSETWSGCTFGAGANGVAEFPPSPLPAPMTSLPARELDTSEWQRVGSGTKEDARSGLAPQRMQ